MKKILFVTGLLIVVFSVGCAPKRMYYWGDYSDTLYAYKKNLNDETMLKHMQELHRIVEESNKRQQRVPPGVYGELGYFYLKANKTEEAVKFFKLEKQLYPESGILMDRLIQKSLASAGDSARNSKK